MSIKTSSRYAYPEDKEVSGYLIADQHTVPFSIFLHLLPGALVTLGYVLLVPPLLRLGISNFITLNLLAVVVLVPVEMGILYRAGVLKNGSFSLRGIVCYREKISIPQLIGFALLIFVWSALISLVVTPIADTLIINSLFSWLPGWFFLDTNFAALSRPTLILTLSLSLICTSWIAPVVEELYFRGYLLPRLSRFGNWAPLINGVLFTLYHFFTPWAFVERVLMVVPGAWIVQKKGNIYILMIAHLLLNTLGILPLLIAALV